VRLFWCAEHLTGYERSDGTSSPTRGYPLPASPWQSRYFDYVSEAVKWDQATTEHALPDALYLAKNGPSSIPVAVATGHR
jgi:hypothetical protein